MLNFVTLGTFFRNNHYLGIECIYLLSEQLFWYIWPKYAYHGPTMSIFEDNVRVMRNILSFVTLGTFSETTSNYVFSTYATSANILFDIFKINMHNMSSKSSFMRTLILYYGKC